MPVTITDVVDPTVAYAKAALEYAYRMKTKHDHLEGMGVEPSQLGSQTSTDYAPTPELCTAGDASSPIPKQAPDESLLTQPTVAASSGAVLEFKPTHNPIAVMSDGRVPRLNLTESSSSKQQDLEKRVQKQPTDFEAWTQLLTALQDAGDPRLSQFYEQFLDEFPLCYGYWKRWALHVYRREIEKNSKTENEGRGTAAGTRAIMDASLAVSLEDAFNKTQQIFLKGLSHIPKSMDLWLAYCKFLTCRAPSQLDSSTGVKINKLNKLDISDSLDSSVKSLSEAEEESVRTAYTQGVYHCGEDWGSTPLWIAAVEFEVETCHNWKNAAHLYHQALSCTLGDLTQAWVSFAEFVKTMPIRIPVRELITKEEETEMDILDKTLDKQERDLEKTRENRRREFELQSMRAEEAHQRKMSVLMHVGGCHYGQGDREKGERGKQSSNSGTALNTGSLSKDTIIVDSIGVCGASVRLDPYSLNRSEKEAYFISLTNEAMDKEEKRRGEEIKSRRRRMVKAQKDWYLNRREQLYLMTLRLCQQRQSFENKIRRPYFHPKELDSAQLQNWRDYLAFEEKIANNARRVDALYERCLVACGHYPEFYRQYSSWKENGSKTGTGTKTQSLYLTMGEPVPRSECLSAAREILVKAHSVYMKRSLEMGLILAEFEESCLRIEEAREVYRKLSMTNPGSVRCAIARASFERRQQLNGPDHSNSPATGIGTPHSDAQNSEKCPAAIAVFHQHMALLSATHSPRLRGSIAVGMADWIVNVLGEVDTAIDILKARLSVHNTDAVVVMGLANLYLRFPSHQPHSPSMSSSTSLTVGASESNSPSLSEASTSAPPPSPPQGATPSSHLTSPQRTSPQVTSAQLALDLLESFLDRAVGIVTSRTGDGSEVGGPLISMTNEVDEPNVEQVIKAFTLYIRALTTHSKSVEKLRTAKAQFQSYITSPQPRNRVIASVKRKRSEVLAELGPIVEEKLKKQFKC
eukprot:GHVN01012627.1.p1 GENE.GHVN01012627.1~~GHVN01012627.1.p1  ORF type:complete len:976 (+),score=212.94 GHVN01012627.1:79-3006(+)